MKVIEGWYLPESDEHFEYHLKAGEQFQGRGTYQFAKIKAALLQVDIERRRRALDIGAHVGLWTFPLAKIFRNVDAWEPVRELADCWNLNCGSLDNATLRCSAVGSKMGFAKMVSPGDNSGNWRVATKVEEQAATVTVPLECIDDFDFRDLDFIKVDVEGFEHQVISGAEGTIKRTRPLIVIEQKPGNAEVYGHGQIDAVKLLQKWGAKVRWIKSGDYCLGW